MRKSHYEKLGILKINSPEHLVLHPPIAIFPAASPEACSSSSCCTVPEEQEGNFTEQNLAFRIHKDLHSLGVFVTLWSPMLSSMCAVCWVVQEQQKSHCSGRFCWKNSAALARQGLPELFYLWHCHQLFPFVCLQAVQRINLSLQPLLRTNDMQHLMKALLLFQTPPNFNLILLITKKLLGFPISAGKTHVKTGSCLYMCWRRAWYWKNRGKNRASNYNDTQ